MRPYHTCGSGQRKKTQGALEALIGRVLVLKGGILGCLFHMSNPFLTGKNIRLEASLKITFEPISLLAVAALSILLADNCQHTHVYEAGHHFRE